MAQLNLIAKVTNACNLRCKYCYVPTTAGRGQMSIETASKLLEQATDYANSVSVTWHGGEPLLRGLDFYQQVAGRCRDLRKTGKRIRNSIQTNGTLVTEAFLDFIVAEDDFGLGLSLDGPKVHTDFSRPAKNGHSSFDAVMKTIHGIKQREQNGIARRLGGGVICVVGNHNIRQLSEIYDFFKNEKIDVMFNILSPSGSATPEMVPDMDVCTRAYCDLFDKWLKDGSEIDVKPFSDFVASLLSAKPRGCQAAASCASSYVSVGPHGDIYPCGRFDGYLNFRLGSIHEADGLRRALSSDLHQKLEDRPKTISAICSACEFKTLCNGGCMHNALTSGDVMAEDPFCRFYFGLFKHISNRLRTEVPTKPIQEGSLNSGGSQYELELITNERVRRIARQANQGSVACFFSDKHHTDHRDRSYKDHSDHSDYSDYRDDIGCGSYD